MKRFFLFFSLVCIAIGCTVDEQPVTPVQEDEIHPLDKAYVYEAFESKDYWKTLSSFEEKLDACQVPVSTAASLTTTALIQTCLNHPFAGTYSAYPDEFEIIKILCNHNNAFKELLNRDDAAKQLVAFYANNTDLPLCEMHFLELLMGSGIFSSLFEEPLSFQLKEAAASQLAYRRMMPDRYSVHSRKTAELLVRELEKKEAPTITSAGNQLKRIEASSYQAKTKASGDLLYYISIYTAYGYSFYGYVFEELTANEITQHDLVYTTLYPNATLIEHSSTSYNDVSYAWNMSMGGPECWLTSYTPFLTDDTYVTVPSYVGADVVYYYGGDFSAIPVNASTLISKWEIGPVMQHAINDCPYTLSSPTYYIYGSESFSISGPDFVYPNTSTPYTYSYSVPFLTSPGSYFVWSIDGPNELSSDYSMYVSSDDLKVVFNDTGEFNLWCRYYYHGICFGTASYLVLVVNSERNEDTEPTE